jgi:TPR repeat protein
MKKMILVLALLHFFTFSPVIATETTESLKLRAACQCLLKEQIVKAEELLRNPKTAQEKGLYAVIIGNDSVEKRRFGFVAFDPNKANTLVQESLAELETKADSDPCSARILGVLYHLGIGVEKDARKAFEYILQAAEEQEPMAMYNAGICYRDGLGVSVDEKKAHGWFLKAGGKGNSLAICALAAEYKDNKEAADWYTKAARLGNGRAMFLAATCKKAYCVELSTIKASNRQNLQQRQLLVIRKLESEANALLKQAAETGYIPAMLELAREQLESDPQTAFYWFKKAATSELAPALFILANCYEHGIGTTKNSMQAEHYYGQAYEAAKKQNNEAVLEEITARLEEITARKDIRQGEISDSQGSGFLLSESGLVVTNYHVVKGREYITVFFPKINKKFQANILLKDTNNDLVILKLKEFDYKTMSELPIPYCLKSSHDIMLGEQVYTLGFPLSNLLGVSANLSVGTISSLSGIENNVSLFQISNPVQPGNSGGPLFDEKGNVVGVVVSSINAAVFFLYTGIIPQNVNFAVKSDYLLTLISMAPEGETVLMRKNQLSSQDLKQQVETVTPYIVSITAKKKQ